MAPTLLPCPRCACHARSEDAACPFCGSPLRDARGGVARTAVATLLGLSAIAGSGLTACAAYGVACTGPPEPTCRRTDVIALCNATHVCTPTPDDGGRIDYFTAGTWTLSIPLAELDAPEIEGLDVLEFSALSLSSYAGLTGATFSAAADDVPLSCVETLHGSMYADSVRWFVCDLPLGASSLTITVVGSPPPHTRGQLEVDLTESVCTGPEEPSCF